MSRRSRYLRNCFLRYDRSARLVVQTVTVDLYTPYRHLIQELFPHAIIIADHLNVLTGTHQSRSSCLIYVTKFVQVISCNLPYNIILDAKIYFTFN
ncbi:transposase [Limosilactobacillus reuteri]